MARTPGEWKRPERLWRRMKPTVRRLRRELTEAEAALWSRLRGHRLGGYQFRRQHPIGRFIVDFCCPACRLVIELDGPIHSTQVAEDEARQTYLAQRGYSVLRFRNDEILADLERLLERIRAAIPPR